MVDTLMTSAGYVLFIWAMLLFPIIFVWTSVDTRYWSYKLLILSRVYMIVFTIISFILILFAFRMWIYDSFLVVVRYILFGT